MACYLQFGKLKGNVTSEGFKDWINLTSMHFGVSRTISMETGNQSNRERSLPQLSEIQVTKKADSSVAGLFKESVSGAKGTEVNIAITRTQGDKPETFMTYKLTDALVSSYSLSVAGDEEPVENISISYSKIEVSYTGADKTNAATSPQRVSYDVASAKAG